MVTLKIKAKKCSKKYLKSYATLFYNYFVQYLLSRSNYKELFSGEVNVVCKNLPTGAAVSNSIMTCLGPETLSSGLGLDLKLLGLNIQDLRLTCGFQNNDFLPPLVQNSRFSKS